MCGVFGYVGHDDNAAAIVLQGLKNLEYRGYDSWGIAVPEAKKIFIRKNVGKIGEVNESELNLPKSTTAVGHVRWATHGGVTEKNAHPHTDEKKEIVVVHNGIIENFEILKKELKAQGHRFRSQTDTETIAHLIEEAAKTLPFEAAFLAAIQKLKGRFAIVAMRHGEEKIIAARRGTPLIVGINQQTNEYYLASDITPFINKTRTVMYIDDEEMVVLQNGVRFYSTQTGKEVKKRLVDIEWEYEETDKSGYPHFMLKEIMEQKKTIIEATHQERGRIERIAKLIQKAYGTYLVGCGTAGKVCLTASYIFAKVAKRHVNVAFGSEFPYHAEFLKKGSLMIAVSQSGETADTLEAIEAAKKKGATIVAIVNVPGSTIDREADESIYTNVGPEKAVASTKATTAQLSILGIIAYALAGKLGNGQHTFLNAGASINDMLNPRYEAHIRKLAEKIAGVESMYVIGKGMNYPMALEAAIKLQEVSYIHAEGFAGGELKHGPIALITRGVPVIVFAPNDETRNDIISNAMEVKARGGYVIGVSPERNQAFDYWIRVPEVGNASPIVNIIPIQILAYQLAVIRQNDPDKPRNLAKSVTVK